jgi:hypothetical protein
MVDTTPLFELLKAAHFLKLLRNALLSTSVSSSGYGRKGKRTHARSTYTQQQKHSSVATTPGTVRMMVFTLIVVALVVVTGAGARQRQRWQPLLV